MPIVASPAPAPVSPAPAPATTPTPVPAPAKTSASTTPLPPTTSQPPAPIPPHVGREQQHEGYEEMSGRSRGQTQATREASREHAHHYGLLSTLDHAALVSMLANRESIDEAVQNHSPSKDSPDMPTAHASDLHTPTSVSEAEASPHEEIWRQSMNREFHGLLQVGTFAPL